MLLISLITPEALSQDTTDNSDQAAVATTTSGDALYERAYRVYDYGRKDKDYYRSKQYLRNAETGFRDFIRKHPKHSKKQQAEYYIGVCQLLTGNVISGEANLERIIRKYGKGHWVGAAAYRMGVQKFNKNAFITASKFFKIASKNYEKKQLSDLALYQYSRCLLLAKRYDLAIEPLEKLVKSDTTYRDSSRFALGKLYYDAKQYNKALPYFKDLTDTKNLDQKVLTDSYLFYGLSLSQSGNNTEALKILERSLNIPAITEKDKAKAQQELIRILYSFQDYDKVIAHYENGLYAGNPAYTAQTYLYAGYSLLKKNYYNRASSAFDTVVDLSPNTGLGYEASYRKLYCFYQLDSAAVPSLADDFYNNYKTYDKSKPWHQLAKVYKAESLYNTGLIEEAAKTYRQIDSADLPSSLEPNFLYKKAICLTESENYSLAVKSISYYLDNYPNHPLVHEMRVRRANALLASNNNTAAIDDFMLVLEELPESPITAIALQGLVKVYSRTNRYEELVDACELLLGKFPSLEQQPKAHANYWLGWAHFKLEDFEKAIPPLSQARRLSPDFYKEPSGTRIFYATYYLKEAKAMKEAYDRILLDVPGKYFPPKMLAWLGVQSYQSKDYLSSRKVLDQIADRENPTETPIEVWRYLAKSYIELDQHSKALEVINIVNDLEESSFWKADTLLDKSTCHFALANYDNAIASAEDGLNLDPKGSIEASLRFVIANSNAIRGNILEAKDQYMLLAAEYQDDENVHPLALWKTAQLIKVQDPSSSDAILSTIKQQYPEWEPPIEE